MFSKLKNRIIIITMAITTAVLVFASGSIILFSSTMRPEPEPKVQISVDYTNQEIKEYIKTDRSEGNSRLLIVLISVDVIIEIIVFLISLRLSQDIVAPVEDSYNKQKTFIANASHELKTPLAVIQANVEALDVEKSNQKWVDNIETEITHANKLVLDLLQLAKMDAGSIAKTPPEKINLPAEIKKHIELFKPKFAGGKITFKSNAKTPEYLLPRQDFFQVLDILLDNATKYGDQKITVTLNQNSLTVANDGATIKKADLDKIFDRFYQTDKTKEGSGLGLAIAKGLCEKNHWHISCESTDHFTAFTINFSA